MRFKTNLDFPRSGSRFSRDTPPNGRMATLAVKSSSDALFSLNLVISLLSALKDLQSRKMSYTEVLSAIHQTLLKVISKEISDGVDSSLDHKLYSTILDASNITSASLASPAGRAFIQRTPTCRVNKDINCVEIYEKDSYLLLSCIEGLREICNDSTFLKSFSIFDENFIKQLPECLSQVKVEKLRGALIEVFLIRLSLSSFDANSLSVAMKLNREICPCYNEIMSLRLG